MLWQCLVTNNMYNRFLHAGGGGFLNRLKIYFHGENGIFHLVYTIWCILYGIFYMVYSIWYILYGIFYMVYYILKLWYIVNGISNLQSLLPEVE